MFAAQAPENHALRVPAEKHEPGPSADHNGTAPQGSDPAHLPQQANVTERMRTCPKGICRSYLEGDAI